MQHRQAGGRLRQLLPAAPLGPGSLKTVRVQFNVDEVGIDAAQVIGPETMTRKRFPAEALDEDVALAHQPQREFAVAWVAEVQIGILLAERSFDVET